MVILCNDKDSDGDDDSKSLSHDMYNSSSDIICTSDSDIMTLCGSVLVVLSSVLSSCHWCSSLVSVSNMQNVFVTGGSSQVEGFEDRLHAEVLAMRPYQSEFRVWSAGVLVWVCGCRCACVGVWV